MYQKSKIIRLAGKAYKRLQIEVIERDNKTCQYCFRFTENAPHHIQYRSQSGSDTAENLILLCIDCHRKVHNHEIELREKYF